MKKLSLLFLAFLSVSLAGCCTSRQSSTSQAGSISKVAFENDRARVLECSTGSGKAVCGAGMHTHPAHLFIMLDVGKLRIVSPDGKESFEDSKAGDIGWVGAEQHTCENLTGNELRCYIVEIKDAEWKPSTGLTK